MDRLQFGNNFFQGDDAFSREKPMSILEFLSGKMFSIIDMKNKYFFLIDLLNGLNLWSPDIEMKRIQNQPNIISIDGFDNLKALL